MVRSTNWLGRHPFKVVGSNPRASSSLVRTTKKNFFFLTEKKIFFRVCSSVVYSK